MGRYGNQPQQNLINMFSPINTEFYQGLLNQAQGNLTQSAGMQAKFLEDAYGQKYLDRATRDIEVGKAEQAVAGALDKDFVSPAQTIKTISKASAGLAPWRNLNEKQLELAKQAEQFKLQHGANALMTDPSKISLTNPDGSLKTPEQLKFTGLNAEDIDKIFLTSEKGELTSKFDRKVKSDLPFKYKFETVEGLSPQEIEQRYGREGADAIRLAEQQIQASPQILDIFDGDKNKAVEYLRNRNLSTAGQFGQSVTSKYVDDDWSLYMAKQRQEQAQAAKTVNPDTPFYHTPGGISPAQNKNIGTVLKNISGGKEEVNWDRAMFNPDGNLMTQGWKTDTRLGGKEGDPYTPKSLVTNPQYKEAVTQLFIYKQMLKKQGFNNVSDKQAIEMVQQAANNSADFYALDNEAISDTFTGNNFSPFVDINGKFKDSKEAELETYNTKTGKWEKTDATTLSDKLGWDDKNSTEKQNLQEQLKSTSDKVIDYWTGEPKLTGQVLDPKGNPTQVRYRMGNTDAERLGTPYAKAQNALVEAGEHNISFNGLNVKFKTAPVMVTYSNGTQSL